MPNREDPDLGPGCHESIEGDIAGPAERDHELAQLALDDAPDERVMSQELDGFPNRRGRRPSRTGLLGCQMREGTFQVREGVRCVDYLRQGLGRRLPFPAARRSSHA